MAPRWTSLLLARGRLAAVGIVLLLLGARPASGCPFCAWMGGRAPPVQRLLAESPVLGVAGPTDEATAEAFLDPNAPRLVGLRAVAVWRGAEHFPAGGTFEAEVVGNLRPEARFLVSGAGEDVAAGALRLRPLTPEGAAVLASYVALHERPTATVGDAALRRRELLSFFLPHLKHRDPVVAEAAYFEFSQASYADLLGLRDRLDPEAILGWLDDPSTPYNRGLLHLMLGLCGAPRHRDLLGARIDGPVDPRPGLDGLLGAYLLLAGSEGLARVERRLEVAAPTPDARRFAVAYVAALRFHETETDRLDPDRLRLGYRRLLGHPPLADLALAEMLRRRDWDGVPEIVALWREHGAARPFLDAAARAWLRASPDPAAAAALGEPPAPDR